MKRSCSAAIILVTLLACGRGERTDQASSDSAAAQSVDSARHSLADFQALRYVEGDWRGSGYEGGPFYETYRFVDDSTIAMTAWTDSTMSNAREQSQYVFRDGIIRTDEDARLVKVDSAGHHFQAPGYAWTFSPVSADRWTARVGPSTIYTMDRLTKR